MISVRQAKIEDKPAIFDFIRRAYQSRWEYKIPERWEWEYIDNPFLEMDELPIWIAEDENGEVVGQSCAMIEPLKIGNRICRVGWGVDMFLDPRYRGQGIAHQLQQANFDAQEVFLSVSMAGAVRRIKASLGSVPIEPVATLLKEKSPDPSKVLNELLDRLIPRGAIIKRGLAKIFRLLSIDKAITTILIQRQARIDERLAAAVDKDVVINPVDRFNEEADQLWERISPEFHALIKRDQVFLNWKYVQQPHMGYTRFVAHKQGKICGYLILRKGRPPEPNIGIFSDLFVSPRDRSTLMALLSYGVKFFMNEGADSIVAATSVREYQEGLAHFGFKKIKEDVPMVHFKGTDADTERSLQPGSWLIGKGDHDWDQYPLAGIMLS